MHSLLHQTYAHAAAAERRERHRPLPVIRAQVRRVRAWGDRGARPRRIRRGRSLPSWAVQTVRLEQRESFVTADGSSIRELAGVPTGNAANQSLAEATVPPGAETAEHFHRTSEEIYLFLSGMGTMRLDGEEAPVRAGDCVVIAPGAVHKLRNPGTEPLVLLCCCAPAYSHEDTVLTGG